MKLFIIIFLIAFLILFLFLFRESLLKVYCQDNNIITSPSYGKYIKYN